MVWFFHRDMILVNNGVCISSALIPKRQDCTLCFVIEWLLIKCSIFALSNPSYGWPISIEPNAVYNKMRQNCQHDWHRTHVFAMEMLSHVKGLGWHENHENQREGLYSGVIIPSHLSGWGYKIGLSVCQHSHGRTVSYGPVCTLPRYCARQIHSHVVSSWSALLFCFMCTLENAHFFCKSFAVNEA